MSFSLNEINLRKYPALKFHGFNDFPQVLLLFRVTLENYSILMSLNLKTSS